MAVKLRQVVTLDHGVRYPEHVRDTTMREPRLHATLGIPKCLLWRKDMEIDAGHVNQIERPG